MKKQNLFLFVLLLISIVAFVACKTSDETPPPTPKPKGIFTIYEMSGLGQMLGYGSRIAQIKAFIRNDGSVAGQITAIVFKIGRDTTLMMEISLSNYSSYCIIPILLGQTVAVGGTGGVNYIFSTSCYLQRWTTIPNKVEVIFYITDGNGYTHEIHETTNFVVI